MATHPTRIWCTREGGNLIVVQDGADGIRVAVIPDPLPELG